MPSMPAMLETLLAPESDPSLRRKSPDGRSTTNVWADEEDGDVNA